MFAKWLLIGALPQLTTWIAFTVLTGALTGSIAGALAVASSGAGEARRRLTFYPLSRACRKAAARVQASRAAPLFIAPLDRPA